MNETTLFLAQLTGPFLAILGLGMVLNPKYYAKAYKAFSEASFSVVLTTMIMIPVGVAMVTKHWVWTSFPEGLISFLGLAVLVKGALLAVAPSMFDGIIKKVLSTNIPVIAGVAWLVGGLYLSWVGYLM